MSYHKLSSLSSQKRSCFYPLLFASNYANELFLLIWGSNRTAVLGSSMRHVVFVLRRSRKLIPFKLICYKLWSPFSLIFVSSRFTIIIISIIYASRYLFHSLSFFFFFTKFNNSFTLLLYIEFIKQFIRKGRR